ncbi:MAG: hypothetical protein JWN48_4803 [Myxococcaceae bacterium]|nr:hypothetical protein [Myxococcaceae bacterium]
MTQLVTVQTDFTDLDQMAEGLVGRVHATHVILPAGEMVDETEWAQFEIALHDGSVGLAGVGRCVTVVDNGDEREPHQRFDVVLDSLQFDTHEQSVFEHILALHGAGGQPVEEVQAEYVESAPPQHIEDTGSFVDVSSDYAAAAPLSVPADSYEEVADESDDQAGEDALPDDRTMVASPDEYEALSDSIPSPGGEANDVLPHAHLSTTATPAHAAAARASHGSAGAAYAHGSVAVAHAVSPALLDDAFEEPLSGERIAPIPQARPLNGNAFAYTDGIPFPAKPPRPVLEASLRVTPAPRPAGSSSH